MLAQICIPPKQSQWRTYLNNCCFSQCLVCWIKELFFYSAFALSGSSVNLNRVNKNIIFFFIYFLYFLIRYILDDFYVVFIFHFYLLTHFYALILILSINILLRVKYLWSCHELIKILGRYINLNRCSVAIWKHWCIPVKSNEIGSFYLYFTYF